MSPAMDWRTRAVEGCAYLDEANISALLPEALSANVQAIFSDETCLVRADSAMNQALAFILGNTHIGADNVRSTVKQIHLFSCIIVSLVCCVV